MEGSNEMKKRKESSISSNPYVFFLFGSISNWVRGCGKGAYGQGHQQSLPYFLWFFLKDKIRLHNKKGRLNRHTNEWISCVEENDRWNQI